MGRKRSSTPQRRLIFVWKPPTGIFVRMNRQPIRLKEMMARFPAELFRLSASSELPAFYPDRTLDYTNEQESIMRSIFRETVRIGWSLPQYKWLVMEQFCKTTAQVTSEEAKQILEILRSKCLNI
ncbi:hypothetical protein ACQ4M3_37085 [Leptolyngbya sp. AN03gr2]|uniref:hypothetical protein n=1 Tax=unclassified Leptolyngbya TaxID=2650499 RepID=UPI003D30F88E